MKIRKKDQNFYRLVILKLRNEKYRVKIVFFEEFGRESLLFFLNPFKFLNLQSSELMKKNLR